MLGFRRNDGQVGAFAGMTMLGFRKNDGEVGAFAGMTMLGFRRNDGEVGAFAGMTIGAFAGMTRQSESPRCYSTPFDVNAFFPAGVASCLSTIFTPAGDVALSVIAAS
jgi:hypothetical protein